MNKFKEKIKKLLIEDDFDETQEELYKFQPLKVVNVLLSLLVTTDVELKNSVVKSFGEVVAKLAENDMESARIVMRRLMQSLNDESGGIGWNSPEAMGEIMARCDALADEYHKILISYARGGSNELIFEGLHKSVILGLKRLSQVRPELIKEVEHLLND